ncbi:MAG: hypothetical protein JWM16_957 [Verrucomicrobiales bacterium]|nr:hypothetical protein [Verrucomicrobiales bacterium]
MVGGLGILVDVSGESFMFRTSRILFGPALAGSMNTALALRLGTLGVRTTCSASTVRSPFGIGFAAAAL